ncbi:MAG: T9SS type A sorting domain-containing protein [Bacteroidia bacterium]
MRRFYTLFTFILMLGLTGASAQLIEGTKGQVPLGDVVNIGQVEEDLMPTMRNINKIHVPGNNLDKDAFYAEKKRLSRILDEQPSQVATSRGTAEEPSIQSGFEANQPSGVPNDNDLAVSYDLDFTGSFIVSVSNTIFRVYDEGGTELLSRSLTILGGAADTIQSAFDPRAIYDQKRDRFIVIYDNGSDPARNNIVICFSQTNNPTGAWNTYALNGNLRPRGIETWMDYPQAEINNDELFITGNLFRSLDVGGSPATGIWQIDLADGYAGNPLDFATYVTSQNVFTLTPVEGAPSLYGPNMYFVTRSRGTNARSFSLYEITDNLTSGQAGFRVVANLQSSQGYGTPPDARQPNSTSPTLDDRLHTGDGRMSTAFRANDNIYFCFPANVSNRPGVVTGKIGLSPLGPNFYTLDMTPISSATLDLGYPSMVYGGHMCQDGNQTKEDYFVTANCSSPSVFTGHAVVYVNTDGDVSDVLLAKAGQGNLNLTGDAADPRNRWGDYTGITYRGNPGETFFVGYHTRPNGRGSTYISSAFVLPDDTRPCQPVVNGVDLPAPSLKDFKVYPNPTIEYVTFEFRVTEHATYKAYVTDMLGRTVRTIIKDHLSPGDVKLGFNAAELGAGTYQVVVESSKTRVFAKQFVVTN